MMSVSDDRHQTLPLFGHHSESSQHVQHPQQQHEHGQQAQRQQRRQPVNPHLSAARKLSKEIRRLPDRSAEQTLTGRAICQHLRALLRETEMHG